MIHFVTALPCEARPLVRRFSMKPVGNGKPFHVYEGKRARLTVSKPGRQNAAEAVSHLFKCSGGERNCAWLNVGAAGHGTLPIGQAVLASQIKDHGTGASWFLPSAEFALASGAGGLCRLPVLTVDWVEKKYSSEWLYEMEAAGFYGRARDFSAVELIQCFKVISDNPFSSVRRVSAEFVESLIEKNLSLLERIAEALEQKGRSTCPN